MYTPASIFPQHLSQGKQRLSVSQRSDEHYLDKNEQPDDVPEWIKLQVLQKAMEMEWNRYPVPDNAEIEQQIGEAMGIAGEQVLLGSGSATFITALLNFFGMQRRQIVIVQPSYSLFDHHCKMYGIDYTPWMLHVSLEYDTTLLPALEKGSVLFIVSPNNPVGSTIPQAMLESVLHQNPGTLVILDAVYTAFSDADHAGLLKKYSNLLILRSLSKELPVAGLRLGYLRGEVSVIAPIRKLMLPFSINPLSLAFAKYVMFEEEFCDWVTECREQLIAERVRMYTLLQQLLPPDCASVFHSAGNFLLVRIHEEQLFRSMMEAFECAGIKVLDTSSMPMLQNTFRVSIGNYKANEAVMECILSVCKPVAANA